MDEEILHKALSKSILLVSPQMKKFAEHLLGL
jgi:hypothetical protein